MAGFLRTNDKGGESPIANFKYVYEMFTNIGWMAANAVATARTNHTFAIAAPSAGARGAYKSGETTSRKSSPVDGAFVAVGRQSSAAQDALVRVARRDRLATKRDLKRTLAFQQQRWKALAKEAKQEGLNSIKLKLKKGAHLPRQVGRDVHVDQDNGAAHLGDRRVPQQDSPTRIPQRLHQLG